MTVPTVTSALVDAVQGNAAVKKLQGHKQYAVNIMMIVMGLFALLFGGVPSYETIGTVSAVDPAVGIGAILLGLQNIAGRAGANRIAKNGGK